VDVNSAGGLAPWERLPGYVFRPYRGHDDHDAMAAVRLGCAGMAVPAPRLPAARALRPGHRLGHAQLGRKPNPPARAAARTRTDGRDRRECHGLRTGGNGAAAQNRIPACLQPGGAGAGRSPTARPRRTVAGRHPNGAVGPSNYREAWKTVVDSYADAAFTRRWTFESFLATADPACWHAAWDGESMAGVALCSVRRHDPTVGENEYVRYRKPIVL
jgi:hypothetical protein